MFPAIIGVRNRNLVLCLFGQYFSDYVNDLIKRLNKRKGCELGVGN